MYNKVISLLCYNFIILLLAISGSLNDEWVIYTLCITGLTLLTCFVHLTLASIKRRSCKEVIVNEKVVSKLGDFNVVDETPIPIVTTGSNATSHDSHGENINFNCHEKQSCTTGIEDDEVGYFDLYFVLKEGPNDQVKEQTSQNERLSTSSFYANVVGQDKTEYHKTYMSPNEYCIDDIYACDVAVTVHKGMERSSRPDEDAKYNMYSKVNKTLQTDWTINSPANESHLSSESQPVYKTTLLEVFRTYLQDCTYKYASLEKTIDDCGAIKPNDENSFIKEKSKTF